MTDTASSQCCDAPAPAAMSASATTCCATNASPATPALASDCCGTGADADPVRPGRAQASGARLLVATLAVALAAGAYIGWAEHAWSWALSSMGLDLEGAWGSSLVFFLYEIGKISGLIALIVFGVGVLGTYLTPPKVQAFLARQPRAIGHALAAGIGAITPFCSCSSVPLYVGMARAGVPLGIGMSFLVASPMINEVAVGLLAAIAGWRVALAYLGFGLAIAVTTGVVMGALYGNKTESQRPLLAMATVEPRFSWDDRVRAGVREVRTIMRQMWPFLVVALVLGAAVHGWVPTSALQSIGAAPWGVLAAVAIGIPLYSGTATAVPLVAPLYAAGVPLGTLMAFLMSVIALSTPEIVMLRKVMPARVLVAFVGVVALGIIAVGYSLNAITT